LYLAVRRSRPDAESIINRFNAQLRGMIADHTYHRLLHLDWIQADVNGSGKSVFVPLNDHAGTSEPKHAYVLFVDPQTGLVSTTKPGFYIGGTTYSDWASVPDRYKIADPNQPPDPKSRTGSIFKFTW
jgi:hypothetical protein